MKPKRYIVWLKKDIDLDDPWQRKWYISQVLAYGRIEESLQRNTKGKFESRACVLDMKR